MSSPARLSGSPPRRAISLYLIRRRPKLLFVTAGSGITPVMAMLRTLKARGESPDIVHIHSAPCADDVIFHDELRDLERTQPGYRLHLQLTTEMGKFDFAALDGLVGDWKERSTWACGPPAMLDSVEKVWADAGMRDKLHTERFAIARTDKGGEGGTVTFAISDKSSNSTARPRCWKPARSSASRCRSDAGWESASPAFCRWNPATCATSGPVPNTARANASKRASPRHPATAPSTFRSTVMAITDIKQYAHLTQEDIEQLGRELDAIRTDIEESRGERDARYVRRPSSCSALSWSVAELPCWRAGTRSPGSPGPPCSAAAKIIENMELGHNIMHGQWDWMNDPEIHSTEWEWDTASPSVQWKHSHNFMHHKYTNIVGMDDDVGYGIMRVTRDQRWNRWISATLSTTCCWERSSSGASRCTGSKLRRSARARNPGRGPKRPAGDRQEGRQAGRQGLHRLSRPVGPRLEAHPPANVIANLIRNYWAYMVIFCGHFPDGAEKFTREEFENETHAEWYLRQMLGSANFTRRPPDGLHERQPVLPDRAPPVPRPAKQPVRRDLRTRSGAMRQVRPAVHDRIPNAPVLQTFWTIVKLSVPTSSSSHLDDAPETHSELNSGSVRAFARASVSTPAPADVAACGPRCASFRPVTSRQPEQPRRGGRRIAWPLSDLVLDQHLPPLPNGAPRQAFSRCRSSTKPSEPSSARATRPSKPSAT